MSAMSIVRHLEQTDDINNVPWLKKNTLKPRHSSDIAVKCPSREECSETDTLLKQISNEFRL